ncbi:hypothetical protein [Nonomuraea sp. NPDC050310]|uniref:hypothetical protein n=1 Tax=unclassified Nonomuraea TaxID=2593643 RepID=UPI0033DBC939
MNAFLAWSSEAEGFEAVSRAVQAVKDILRERQYGCYDWAEQPHSRNIGTEIQEQIRKSDILILEGSTIRPNLAFEVGFARALDLPVVVIKQEGTKELPEDFGAPRYLNYPSEAGNEAGFAKFELDFGRQLERLEEGSLSRGHRALRSRLTLLNRNIQDVLNGHDLDHPQLHLRSGWLQALASEVGKSGRQNLITDADYYSHCFAELREWNGGPIHAIADLTDDTETFWQSDLEHPEQMSAQVTERIFLVDWRLFFQEEGELSRYITMWAQQKASLAESDYEIYVAAVDDVMPGRALQHPFGDAAVGRHLLLLNPDCIGGYRKRSEGGPGERRMLHIERDAHRFNAARRYYESIKNRAVRFELTHDFHSLKRDWLAKLQIGRWDPHWTVRTERRSPAYFDRYDQHIRCWIPSYDQMVQDCSALVASEIMRIFQELDKSVSILEIGYGTGSLTEAIMPWIRTLCEPFDRLGLDYPVDHYRAVDRAGQMRRLALTKLGSGTTHVLRLMEKKAWEDIEENIQHNVIFGSLVTHFLLGMEPDEKKVDTFFAECVQRLAPGGSLVFADCFGPDTPEERELEVENWRLWMIDNGLSEEYVDAYLAGNQDMVNAVAVGELESAAARYGLRKVKEKVVGGTQMFRLLVFRHDPAAR